MFCVETSSKYFRQCLNEKKFHALLNLNGAMCGLSSSGFTFVTVKSSKQSEKCRLNKNKRENAADNECHFQRE